MIPIYEQGNGKGIGYNYDYFLSRFKEICNNGSINRKAKAFAFLLYDFHHPQIRKILKDEGFIQLDRLSGEDLGIFYMHATERSSLDLFNIAAKEFAEEFAKIDKKDLRLPLILFFKVMDDIAYDFKIVELGHDLRFAFHELYKAIEDYTINLGNSRNHATKVSTVNMVTPLGIEISKSALSFFVGEVLTSLKKSLFGG